MRLDARSLTLEFEPLKQLTNIMIPKRTFTTQQYPNLHVDDQNKPMTEIFGVGHLRVPCARVDTTPKQLRLRCGRAVKNVAASGALWKMTGEGTENRGPFTWSNYTFTTSTQLIHFPSDSLCPDFVNSEWALDCDGQGKEDDDATVAELVGDVLRKVLIGTDFASLPSSEIDLTSIAALSTAQTAKMRFYIDQYMPVGAVIAKICTDTLTLVRPQIDGKLHGVDLAPWEVDEYTIWLDESDVTIESETMSYENIMSRLLIDYWGYPGSGYPNAEVVLRLFSFLILAHQMEEIHGISQEFSHEFWLKEHGDPGEGKGWDIWHHYSNHFTLRPTRIASMTYCRQAFETYVGSPLVIRQRVAAPLGTRYTGGGLHSTGEHSNGLWRVLEVSPSTGPEGATVRAMYLRDLYDWELPG